MSDKERQEGNGPREHEGKAVEGSLQESYDRGLHMAPYQAPQNSALPQTDTGPSESSPTNSGDSTDSGSGSESGSGSGSGED